jgi:hypothetical protein
MADLLPHIEFGFAVALGLFAFFFITASICKALEEERDREAAQRDVRNRGRNRL